MPASTVMPDVVTEIAFTTGPNDPSPVWVDVSPYVEAQSFISISRGRADELGAVQPSRMVVALDNRDGRFTPGNTGSPYYPNVKKGRRIRQRAMWPLATSYADRFSGYVDEWPVVWPDGTSAFSTVTVTASSRLSRLGRSVELRSIIEEEYLDDDPAIYYPLGDPEGTTQAGNVSTVAQPVVSTIQVGSGGTIIFGSATGPGTDDLTAAQFTPVNASNFKFLRCLPAQPIVTASHTTFTMECFFLSSSSNGQDLVYLDLSTGNGTYTRLYIESPTGVLRAESADWTGVPQYYFLGSATAVNNGATHHALIRETISGGNLTATLYLDGVQVATSTTAYTAFTTRDRLSLGGSTFGVGGLTGTLAHTAVTPGTTEMTAARVAGHSDSGLTGFSGERTDQRIQRLARFAGVPSSEVTVETGLSTSITNQITNGKTALALMTEVTDTEGGALFDARNGNLTFHARSHRYNAASALTLSAGSQEIESDLAPKLDDQGLLNDMTATREGGISTRAVDTVSIDNYGLYRESIVLLTTSDNEVVDAANWKVLTRSTPAVRISQVSVDLLNCSSAQKTALLAREIGDRITLSGLPSSAPASSMDFFIEGYSEQIGAESYRMTFNLSPADQSGVWQLDSSVYSVLGTTTRLGY